MMNAKLARGGRLWGEYGNLVEEEGKRKWEEKLFYFGRSWKVGSDQNGSHVGRVRVPPVWKGHW